MLASEKEELKQDPAEYLHSIAEVYHAYTTIRWIMAYSWKNNWPQKLLQ